MEKHKRYNHLFEEVNNIIHTAKNITKSEWNLNKSSHRVIRLAMLCKYYKTLQAIGQLDIKGYFEDAEVLLRCEMKSIGVV